MTFDEQLKRAVDTLGDRLRENLARELRAVTDKLAEAQAVQRASGAAAVQAPPAASHDLVVAFRAIDEAGSLSEILETVATRAAREAARAAVLLVRGGSVRSWRLVGFPSSGDTHIDIPFGDAGIVADAVRSGLTTRAIASGHPAPAFAELPA